MVKEQVNPSERVDEKPQRRHFSPEYKLRIIREADGKRSEPGGVGELLRREGLYSSLLSTWRKELAEQTARGIAANKRGPKPDPDRGWRQEKDKLERQLSKVSEENRQLRLIVAAQKKMAELFPDPSENGG
jgi:transposase